MTTTPPVTTTSVDKPVSTFKPEAAKPSWAKPIVAEVKPPVTKSASKAEAVPANTPIKADAGTKPVEIKPDAQTGERKFKVKVDGRVMEVTEAELVKGYSLASTANKRIEEATLTRKQAEQFIDMLRKDPTKVLTDPNLGIDMKKIAEQYLIQQYQDEIDPKGKETREMREKLEKYEAEKKERELAETQARQQAETQRWMQKYSVDIDTAISSTPNLPKTEAVYNRVIHYLMLGIQHGQNYNAADVIPLVEQDFRTWTKDLYKNATPDQLLEYFGEDIAKKIRQKDMSRLKNPISSQPVNKPAFTSKRQKEAKPTGISAWKEQLRQRDIAKGIK